VRRASSGGASVVRELLDIVREAVPLSLRVDLGAASPREPIEVRVRAQIRLAVIARVGGDHLL
jgi:hypothetical protein